MILYGDNLSDADDADGADYYTPKVQKGLRHVLMCKTDRYNLRHPRHLRLKD